MEITIFSQNKRIKKKIDKELSWYDTQSKKNTLLNGSNLFFSYDYKKRQMVPTAKSEEVVSYQSSYNDIWQWVNSKISEFDLSIVNAVHNSHIIVDVPNNNLDDFTSELYTNGMQFVYDESVPPAVKNGKKRS